MKLKNRSALLTSEFWVNLAIISVKTAAQAAVAVMTGVQTGLLKDVDFGAILQVGGYAALACVLWNVSVAGEAEKDPEPLPPAPQPVPEPVPQPVAVEPPSDGKPPGSW